MLAALHEWFLSNLCLHRGRRGLVVAEETPVEPSIGTMPLSMLARKHMRVVSINAHESDASVR